MILRRMKVNPWGVEKRGTIGAGWQDIEGSTGDFDAAMNVYVDIEEPVA